MTLHRPHRLTLAGTALFAALLIACGGDTTPTATIAAPTTAPTVAAAATATRPATTGSVVSGTTAASPAAATTAPTTAASSAAGTTTAGSPTRPAGTTVASAPAGTTTASATTVGTMTAASATRPAGTTAASAPAGTTTAASVTRPAGTTVSGSASAGIPAGTSAAGVPTKVYTDAAGRFTFSYPATWAEQKSDTSGIVVQFVSDTPMGVFNIITQDSVPGASLDLVVSVAQEQLKAQIPGYMPGPGGLTKGTIDGNPAQAFDYYGTLSGQKIYFQQLVIVHSNVAYIFSAVAPGATQTQIDAYNKQLDIVDNSFKFLK